MKRASWKTTLGGLIAAAGPVIKHALAPEWQWLGDALLAIGVAIVGSTARDNSVTSERAGASR